MKEQIAKVFVFLLGVGLIIWTTYYKWAGLSTNLNFWGPGSVAGVGLGVLLIVIALVTRVFCFYIAIWFLVGGVTLLAADNALYLLSPRLPYALIKWMSPEAQSKYLYSNPDRIASANDGKVNFGRPGSVREYYGFSWIVDELGYQNPPEYLRNSGGADVLILGDSFIEYGATPQYLRQFLAPVSVYAAAIAGSGPPRWRLHFNRYRESSLVLRPPKVVVLNFYSGNDITDTISQKNEKGLSRDILQAANPEWPIRKLSLFYEVFKITQRTVFPLVGDFLGIQTRTLMFQSEPNLVLADGRGQWNQFLESLSGIVSDIRETDQRTAILVSYQATVGAIYGIDPERCKIYMTENFHRTGDYSEECEVASARQLELSRLLGDWAQVNGVHFVDPTTELQQAAFNTPLFLANDGHLSADGCRIYAEVIAHRMIELSLLGGQ